ncbi:hypothetical protein AWB78_07909 [Caballeronia calidae]|uniref:Uncharacterized protein n=1 Tax=Caballeronia calidae TaxID=1777139 RepID=A0A158EH45_9BURK|nr:hypothetical protein AWB78_07909 [Caballeronia calidae]
MLVTDASWAESDPVRRALAHPLLAWQCFGWTSERPIYLALAPRRLSEWTENLPEGWVCYAEILPYLAALCGADQLRVFVYEDLLRLRPVTGLWRKRDDPKAEAGYWSSTTSGGLKPPYRTIERFSPGPEFVQELQFGRDRPRR